MRSKIGKILVECNLRTDQRAIGKLVKLIEGEKQQTILELIAHFSEYNVPLQMTAEDVQRILRELLEGKE